MAVKTFFFYPEVFQAPKGFNARFSYGRLVVKNTQTGDRIEFSKDTHGIWDANNRIYINPVYRWVDNGETYYGLSHRDGAELIIEIVDFNGNISRDGALQAVQSFINRAVESIS